jgi:hypothetical protein
MEPLVQASVLKQIASRIPPGGRALIRTAFRDGSWRYLVTLLEEVFVRASGWIRGGACQFPARSELASYLRGAEWRVSIQPMWGRTPFNSHLVEIERTTSR